MKRMICFLTVLLLCCSLVIPAYAAENDFVPSISYKESPTLVTVTGDDGNAYIGVIRDADGNVLDYIDHKCLRITPISHIWDEEIEVPNVIRELLLFVYNSLNDGTMEIPYEKHEANLDADGMVIRDLFDVRWECEEHAKMLDEPGVVLELTFELGVDAEEIVYVMTYGEGTEAWDPIVKTVNNGDGTVTCTFEHLCAVEFSMAMNAATVAPAESNSFPVIWIVLFALAVVAIVAVLVVKGKKKTADPVK